MNDRLATQALKNLPAHALLKKLERMDLYIKNNVQDDPVKELPREFQEDHAWVQHILTQKMEVNAAAHVPSADEIQRIKEAQEQAN